jgi:hypothetical protein
MAAKRKAPVASRITAKKMAARQKRIDSSNREIEKAHKNLQLKLKKHKQTLSAMFFIP